MNGTITPGLQVLVLAAGLSSRLGRPKPLATVHSTSLLRTILALAARVSRAEIVVVLPPRAQRYRIEARGFNVLFAINAHRASGLSSSVHRGLSRARRSAAVLLLPVDLAALGHRDLARLVSRWRGCRRCVIARRIAKPDGTQQGGIPLILPRWLYARALEVTGDVGLRDMVNGLPARQRVLLDLPSAAADVDTPQDLSAARRRIRP